MLAERYDTVIVGGGVAGLIAANLLARGGQSVVVLERSKRLGGRGMTRVEKGYYLNVGAHALYKQGAAARISAELNIHPAGNLPIINHHSLAMRDGIGHAYPSTPRAILQTTLLTAGEKLKMAGAMVKVMRAKSAELQHTSWQQWLNDNVASPAVRDLFVSIGRLSTYANDPTVSAAAVIGQLQMVLGKNVLYLDHGWQQWIDLLAEKAQEAGATIVCQSPVRQVEADAVTLANGTRIGATHIVLAVPAPNAVKLLPLLAEQTQHLHPARVASLTVGVSHVPNPKVTFASGIDRPSYFSLHSAAAQLAPQGGGLMHAMLYLSPDWDSSAENDRAELEEMFDQIQPGWRDYVEVEEYLPRITVAYGILRYDRPRPTHETRFPNVHVAGDWVGDEGMLVDAAAASARAAAEAILNWERETGVL